MWSMSNTKVRTVHGPYIYIPSCTLELIHAVAGRVVNWLPVGAYKYQ